MDEEEVPRYLQSLRLGARPEQVIPNSNQALTGQQRGGAVPPQAGWEVRKGGMDDELQMGMFFKWQSSQLACLMALHPPIQRLKPDPLSTSLLGRVVLIALHQSISSRVDEATAWEWRRSRVV